MTKPCIVFPALGADFIICGKRCTHRHQRHRHLDAVPANTQVDGCEGLKAIEGENILIRDAPRTFAEAVLEILSDSELQSRLGVNGRKTAEQTYSWDIVGRGLCAYYWRQLRTSVLLREVQ